MKVHLTFALVLSCLTGFAQSNTQFHFKSILVDTHNDVLSSATMKGLNIEDDLKEKTHSDLSRLKEGGVDVQIFSIFCNEKYGKGTAFNFALREIDSLDAIVKRNPDKAILVNNPSQLLQAIKTGKIACMKGVEGGHMIEDKISNLDSLYSRGVRYMTLTWNNSTPWASSGYEEAANKVAHKGLNDFGKQIVSRMNELGMMVDLSHVGGQTFWDAINITTKPVIVSHSCCYSICPSPRNLKDDQIKAVGKNGGVIHLNFYSGFLDSTFSKNQDVFIKKHSNEVDSIKKSGDDAFEFFAKKYPSEVEAFRPPLSTLIDHIDHIVQLAGVDHVGLGSDFDGIESTPKGLDGVEDYPKVTEALLQRGYSKQDVRKILGENFLRVFAANQHLL